MIYGNAVGGIGLERTYILTDENGTELVATFVESEAIFDATANDIRAGKVAATDTGVVTGKKIIPSYHTQEGYKVVTNGSDFVLSIPEGRHAYTKLQAIFCPFNTSLANSVAAEKVAIENNVYSVRSTTSEAEVTVDDVDTIHFGITNTSDKPYLIRYFTYKEIY
jgi:hypothetical protein